jgi:uncharacterized coiled-coil protein SlyX
MLKRRIEFEQKLLELEKRVNEQSEKIEKLESTLAAVKIIASDKRKNDEIERKNKWLNGYPDETSKVRKGI